MEHFNCRCGAANCCGWVKGIAGNSVIDREKAKGQALYIFYLRFSPEFVKW